MIAVKKESSLFPVKEDIIYTKNGDESGYKFIMREDTDDILSCMTKEYKLVSNSEVWEAANPILNEMGAVLTEENIFSNGARTSWTWKIPDVKVKITRGDELNPQITIRNSYDGSFQLGILSGAFRLLCSNGLILGNILSHKVNRHSIYNTNLDKIDKSIKDTVDMMENVFVKELPVLVKTKTKPKDIQKLVKLFPDFTMDALTQYLLGNKINNFWDLLNAATWVSTHTMKRNYESTHKLESRIYPSITKWANQAAKA